MNIKNCHNAVLINGVSTIIPKCRMVCVMAWVSEEGDFSESHDVIFINAVAQSQFSIFTSYLPSLCSTREEYLQAGWAYDGDYIAHQPIILHKDYGLVSCYDELLFCGDHKSEVVVLNGNNEMEVDLLGLKLVSQLKDELRNYKKRREAAALKSAAAALE